MRLLLHTLVTLVAAAILGGVSMYYVEQQRGLVRRDLARHEVQRFQRQIHLQAALAADLPPDKSGPATIDPAWFEGDIPENPLVGTEHPWVEIAGADHKTRVHPPDLTVSDADVACFWYNPYTGIVRARVPIGISDAHALDLYNDVNECDLPTLFPEEPAEQETSAPRSIRR